MPFGKVFFLNTGTKKLKRLLEITKPPRLPEEKNKLQKIVYYPPLVIFHLFITKAALYLKIKEYYILQPWFPPSFIETNLVDWNDSVFSLFL